MKSLAIIIATLQLVISSTGAALTKDELINQLQDLNRQQVEEAERGQRVLIQTTGLLQTQAKTLETAQAQVNQVETERDRWQQYGNQQHEFFINAEKRVAEQESAKLKWMGAFIVLALLVAAFVGIKYFTPWGRLIP